MNRYETHIKYAEYEDENLILKRNIETLNITIQQQQKLIEEYKTKYDKVAKALGLKNNVKTFGKDKIKKEKRNV